MMRQYLEALTPDQIALIHVAFTLARDWNNAKICREAGEANCGDEYESALEAAFEKVADIEERKS